MPGDYTRLTFDPLRDFSRVRAQQGRVVLDADLNELADAADHRLRALALDVLGPCTAPLDLDAQPTPAVTGFQIAASGSSFTIGLGRLYLHGLELDNHGPAPYHAEPGLQDARGGPVTYEQQPYYPAPPAIPDGRHVVYVDAWDREVTAVEDGSLLDSAVGVDTAARTQTVWQVKILAADATGVTCTTPDADVPGWTEATMPSAGRLSTLAVDPPADTDPCSVPPVGGYRGWDNRLYRVEVHDGGTTAQATFKWSRDNASVATRVTDVDSTRTVLTLVRTGRDDVQRIREQAWVEVLDDSTELSGTPGFLAQVQSVTPVGDVTQQVTLSAPIPPSFDPATLSRRTRLRQWDQIGTGVTAEGTLNVADTLSGLVLEDGVQVTFSDDPSGGLLKTGDYWTFPARSADATVQVLTAAPPQGPRHFYGRLAIVDLPDEVVDCRGVWPPTPTCECSGDCTVCVTPQTHASGQLTIQTAVSQVSTAGGTVCLAAGRYDLTAPVAVNGARSVTIRGQGYATTLVYGGDIAAVIVDSSTRVTIRDLAVTGSGADYSVAMGIAIRQSTDVRIDTVAVSGVRSTEGLGTIAGPLLGRLAAPAASAVAAASPASTAVPDQQGVAIALGGVVTGVTIRDCVLKCSVGVARWFTEESLLLIDFDISNCAITGLNRGGIVMDEQTQFMYGAQVRDSVIAGVYAPGITWHAPAVGDASLVIADATITGLGTGLDLACSGAVVRDCTIIPQDSGGTALALGTPPGADNLADVHIRDCLLSGYTGINLTGALQDVEISGCTVTGVGGGIVMNPDAIGLRVTVRDNDIRISGDLQVQSGITYGISLVQVTDAKVRSNRVRGLPLSGIGQVNRWMISLNACPSGTVSGNTVTNLVAPENAGFVSFGVYAFQLGRIDIIDNVVEVGDGVATPTDQQWQAIGIYVTAYVQLPGGRQATRGARVARQLGHLESMTAASYVMARGQLTCVTPYAVRQTAIGADPATTVRGNRLEINGVAAAVAIYGNYSVLLNDNQVRHLGVSTYPGTEPAVHIEADSLAACGNRIETTLKAIQTDVAAGPPAIVGNVTTTSIWVGASVLAAPWKDLNVVTP